MRRISCNEMRKRGGEDIGSVTHGAATFVYEFQFLAFVRGEEVGNEETWVLLGFSLGLKINF